jgi:hypothetical protein
MNVEHIVFLSSLIPPLLFFVMQFSSDVRTTYCVLLKRTILKCLIWLFYIYFDMSMTFCLFYKPALNIWSDMWFMTCSALLWKSIWNYETLFMKQRIFIPPTSLNKQHCIIECNDFALTLKDDLSSCILNEENIYKNMLEKSFSFILSHFLWELFFFKQDVKNSHAER